MGTARARWNFWQGATRSDRIVQIDRLARPDARTCVKRSQRASGSRDNACGGWPSWRSGVPDETPRGPGGPPRSDAHASASPDIKTGTCHKSFKTYELLRAKPPVKVLNLVYCILE